MSRCRKHPKSIKIGYATFKLKHVSRKTSGKNNNKDFLGECDYTNHTITIFGNQAPSEMTDSILHECMHGIAQIFNIKFRSAREEERYVRHFTNGLTTLFRDNPELLDYIQDSLKREPPAE